MKKALTAIIICVSFLAGMIVGMQLSESPELAAENEVLKLRNKDLVAEVALAKTALWHERTKYEKRISALVMATPEKQQRIINSWEDK